jgi:hypothetical protein
MSDLSGGAVTLMPRVAEIPAGTVFPGNPQAAGSFSAAPVGPWSRSVLGRRLGEPGEDQIGREQFGQN